MITNEHRETRRPDDVVYGTDPTELFVTVRRGRPSYIRVGLGEYVQEGDVFHRERMGTESHLPTWAVTEITPTHVVGRELETGVEKRWNRDELARGLVVGRYSTNLTEFERLSVIEMKSKSTADGPPDENSEGDTDRPVVTVIAYGDNGQRYGRRYRFVGGSDDRLELWTEDSAIERFSDEVRARLDERVRAELDADGYDVRAT